MFNKLLFTFLIIQSLVSATVYQVPQNKWGIVENTLTHNKETNLVYTPGTYLIEGGYMSLWPSDDQLVEIDDLWSHNRVYNDSTGRRVIVHYNYKYRIPKKAIGPLVEENGCIQNIQSKTSYWSSRAVENLFHT